MKSVLIVDDTYSMRKHIIRTLESLGYEAKYTEAKNGNEALEQLRENPYFDLVLADWDMPIMNGLELAIAVKKSKSLKNIPLVFITNMTSVHNVETAMNLKIDGYITKPFTPDKLRSKLDKYFQTTFKKSSRMDTLRKIFQL